MGRLYKVPVEEITKAREGYLVTIGRLDLVRETVRTKIEETSHIYTKLYETVKVTLLELFQYLARKAVADVRVEFDNSRNVYVITYSKDGNEEIKRLGYFNGVNDFHTSATHMLMEFQDILESADAREIKNDSFRVD